MAARFPERYYIKAKYAVRDEKGHFVKANSAAAQRFIMRQLELARKAICYQLFEDINKGSRAWVDSHLTQRNVPFATGNLLNSMGVVTGYRENTDEIPGQRVNVTRMQHWGRPQPGSGFGEQYWLDASVESPYHEGGILNANVTAGNGVVSSVAAVLVSAIPYSPLVNRGNSKNPYYAGWFTRLAESFGDAIMWSTGIKGLSIKRGIKTAVEQWGHASSENYYVRI